MANEKVCWDTVMMADSIQKLRREQDNLRNQRKQMKTQQERVDTNWKSPAGQQYQSRLQNDVVTLDNILKEMNERTDALQKVKDVYIQCEQRIQIALNKLPNLK
jgi:uncharacterized protein YukE